MYEHETVIIIFHVGQMVSQRGTGGLTHMLFKVDAFDLFDDFFWRRTSHIDTRANSLPDFRLDDGSLVMSLDVPGAKKDDVEVKTIGRTLAVSGKVRGKSFDYKYNIEKDYDVETPDALLEDGVLTVKFKRLKEVTEKKIEVKTK